MRSISRLIHLTVFTVIFLLAPAPSWAVPSFARQTGLSCNSCHTMFPQLNAFGRSFKLNGYTMTSTPTITGKDRAQEEALRLVSSPPFSIMGQFSYSKIGKKQPDTQNDNTGFPQEFSIFMAGALTPKIGMFGQATYEQTDGTFRIDNTDLRYADTSPNLLYGLTANNNPTVQDVWNTTPAWGFPFASSSYAPSPSAATQLEGALSQRVAGVGAYALYDQWLYAEATMYRSADQGAPAPPGTDSTNTIKGVSPYWRLAAQKSWGSQYIEAGTFGMYTQNYPSGVSGATDKFTDAGFDTQYENYLPQGTLVARGRWIYERQNYDATIPTGSGTSKFDLNTLKADVGYYFLDHYGVDLGYFNSFGSTNSTIYSPASVTGSANGKPNSDGFVAELDYLPWMNTKFSLQYVLYDKFNGSSSNYDGSGRNANNNNTLYLLAWFAF